MFAALIIDRDPYTFADFPGLAQAWFQDAGGFFYAGLLFFLLVSFFRPQAVPSDSGKKGVSLVPLGAWVVATILYAVYGLVMLSGANAGPKALGLDLLNIKQPPDPNGYVKVVPPRFSLAGYQYDDLPAFVRVVVPPPELGPDKKRPPMPYPWQALLLTLGGVASFVGAVAPPAGNLLKLRGRRIWAMAVLCMKEGLRNRLFVAFLVIVVPLMFPVNWFIQPKPEDDLRDAVNWVIPLTAAPLVLLAILLTAYALPNDVKSQNIYTVVTKPVERFEIVLGRFLGYLILLTGVVGIVGGFTLLTITGSQVSQAAWDETGRARVPVRGKLSFQSRKADFAGTDVGKEFNYRKHIGGSPNSPQRAVYSFRQIPSSLARMPAVPLEFNFDIFRLTKGEENKGVFVNVRVASWQRDQTPPAAEGDTTGEWRWGRVDTDVRPPAFRPDPAEGGYRADALAELRKVSEYATLLTGPDDQAQAVALQLLSGAKPDSAAWPAAKALARKYGFFEYRQKEVYDFHPERVEVPPELFEYAAESATPDGRTHTSGKPRVTVYIQCTSASQMLGMAEGDLYFLEAEESFSWNHLKSMVGLWCWLVLAAGLAVTLSTYLDFIVTLLTTLFLFVVAFFDQFIAELGQSINRGGTQGPFTALNQLLQAKQPTALPEGTSLEQTAEGGDAVSSWLFRRVLNVLPDVHSFEWTRYVAEGFSIPGESLAMNLVVLVAYLFPWFLMAYYLIRRRARPTRTPCFRGAT